LGIGLAICRRIIASHHGKIRVESSELGGARFVFSLPVSTGAPKAQMDRER
jgi:signal transduction histidine kinase